MSFEGTDIANDGTVPFRSGERISFSYLISQKYTDEQVGSHPAHKGFNVKHVNIAQGDTIRLGTPYRLGHAFCQHVRCQHGVARNLRDNAYVYARMSSNSPGDVLIGH